MPEKERQLLELLRSKGAAFFGALHEALGGGYPGETLDALWNLVWRGLVTNDTFHALRAYMHRSTGRGRYAASIARQIFVRAEPCHRVPRDVGLWCSRRRPNYIPTAWSHAVALQLLNRHGIVTRESMQTENISGGFSAVYDVLKANGRIRTRASGLFCGWPGCISHFALPSAVDLLRSLRNDPEPEKQEMVVLAATDPANLYGSVLRWPSAPVVTADGGSSRIHNTHLLP